MAGGGDTTVAERVWVDGLTVKLRLTLISDIPSYSPSRQILNFSIG
jgi:hypothetical protein